MADEETLDVDAMVDALNRALRLQYRSILSWTLAAGSATGFEHQALADRFAVNAADDLADARRLVEKIASLGGEPADDPAEVTRQSEPAHWVDHLVEIETEAINALQDAIEPTGREGRSEAIEHRLEHMIMRKQEAVDVLLRARGRPAK
jgi:bacterioferritin (cytochrome b1)